MKKNLIQNIFGKIGEKCKRSNKPVSTQKIYSSILDLYAVFSDFTQVNGEILPEQNNLLSNNANKSNEILNWLLKNRNEKILEKLRKKVQNGEKIKVGFIVIWASQFSSSKLYELMKENPVFEPVIIVNKIPYISAADDIRFKNVFENSVQQLKEQYGNENVLANFENGKYIDYSNNIDIAIFNMIHPTHLQNYIKIPYLLSKDVLSILIPYGFYISKTSSDELVSQDTRYEYVKYMYKFYVDNEYLYSRLIEKLYNCTFYGYPKIDKYYDYTKNSDKTSIILAPHQDLNGCCFCGNFLKTYKVYQEIPKMFPDIEFVFRPHPLWFSNVSFEWGKEKTEEYLNSVINQPNVTYSTEGDYYQIFANSSAMIHDCGSFLPEYMVTNKPAMYLQDNKDLYSKYYNNLGIKCLDNMYIGSSVEEVRDFIQKTVIEKNDYMKENRVNFVKENLLGCYPDISKKILEDIIKDIG